MYRCTFTYDADHTPTIQNWRRVISSRSVFYFGGVFHGKFAEQYRILFDDGSRGTGIHKKDSSLLDFGLSLYEQQLTESWDEFVELVCYLPVMEAGAQNFTVHITSQTKSVIESPGDTVTVPFRGREEG